MKLAAATVLRDVLQQHAPRGVTYTIENGPPVTKRGVEVQKLWPGKYGDHYVKRNVKR